jgi:hypothetical protein
LPRTGMVLSLNRETLGSMHRTASVAQMARESGGPNWYLLAALGFCLVFWGATISGLIAIL